MAYELCHLLGPAYPSNVHQQYDITPVAINTHTKFKRRPDIHSKTVILSCRFDTKRNKGTYYLVLLLL